MDISLFIFIVVIGILGYFGLALLFDLPLPSFFSGFSRRSAQMQNMVQAQRSARMTTSGRGDQSSALLESAEKSRVDRVSSSRLTLEKRLRYAGIKVSPSVFLVGQILISVTVAALVHMRFGIVLTLMALMLGPIVINGIINSMMDTRFKAFDKDYAQFLMSLVALIKTGLNTVTGLEAAAKGLDEGCLVQEEVFLMLDRLRVGVPEDKSIGAFGEDIYHPEIELFVQAILLSRRVGGNLSETLERLSKQVRKRQYFRLSAASAISLQKASVWLILVILIGLFAYFYRMAPESMLLAWTDPVGWSVWQFGLIVILIGLYWIRQVVKIRI